MYREYHFEPEEIIQYLRKSRSDDPYLTVEEVLAKHEMILGEWTKRNLSSPIPEENIYREVVSGETIDDRPEMLKVLRRIESPRIKAILIVEVQRLSRGDLEDAGRLIKLLRYTNTLVITPSKIYDLQDEYDRDGFERELKRGNDYLEYTKKILKRGREQSIREGNFVGNTAPYGYEKGVIMEGKKKCHTLFIIEEEAEVVRMIFDLYVNQHMGRTNIANYLNSLGIKPRNGRDRWSIYTIVHILENEHYTGKVRWNYRKTTPIVENGEVKTYRPKSKDEDVLLFPGKHEAIISDELFQAAKARMGKNYRARPTTKVRNPLAGLLYCQCGRAMSLRTYHKNGVERSAPRLLCDDQAYCHTSSAFYDDVVAEVSSVLENAIRNFEFKINSEEPAAIARHKAHIKRLENNLEELKRKEISQWEKYSEEGMPKAIFEKLNEKVLKDIADTEKALKSAESSLPDIKHYEECLRRFRDALDALHDPSIPPATKNILLKSCIERIDYHRENSVRLTRKNVSKDTVLKTGGNWDTAPIELDVKLRL